MILRRIESMFTGIGLAALIILVFSAATLRWLGIDMSWSTDMAQLVFAWVCFIGADLAMKQKRHMGVEILTDKLPVRMRNSVYLINSLLILVFLVFVVYYGTNLVVINYRRSFNTLPISYSFVTASAPVGSLLMIYTITTRIFEYLKNFMTGDYSNLETNSDDEGGETI
ncbi:TRAP transporter small permease [Anoxynatronum buryatiense]|uniref:TRAP-type C4-dicarboxylate transport system, small permease component n=1 Tax=Anoxynatronum buryatiense TaxID=489973 RepID=A0AA46AJ89_9CLOT|nr:TRAP transporter small permease [Anoxynatronum buryatiense]SMP59030.1 TRAP-type C4-dicarboxylate transport system, small permease component [Anoxynatronum buryatiense]